MIEVALLTVFASFLHRRFRVYSVGAHGRTWAYVAARLPLPNTYASQAYPISQ